MNRTLLPHKQCPLSSLVTSVHQLWIEDHWLVGKNMWTVNRWKYVEMLFWECSELFYNFLLLKLLSRTIDLVTQIWKHLGICHHRPVFFYSYFLLKLYKMLMVALLTACSLGYFCILLLGTVCKVNSWKIVLDPIPALCSGWLKKSGLSLKVKVFVLYFKKFKSFHFYVRALVFQFITALLWGSLNGIF